MKVEPDLEKVKRAMLAYKTFLFTMKAVTVGMNVRPTPEEQDRIWKTVNEVAAGDITLNVTGAEAARDVPDIYPKAKVATAQAMNDNMRRERELAKMLVDAAEGFSTPSSG
jgi:O6-methylguanine-DNA--protein-cysteine methyltransferase